MPFPEPDQLGTTPAIGDMQTESVAPPASNPPSSLLTEEPGTMAVPGGSQSDVEMPPAEAYLQGWGSFQQ